MRLSQAQRIATQGFQNMYLVDGYGVKKIKPKYLMVSPFNELELQLFSKLVDNKKRVYITGPRQTGKTFLLNHIVKEAFSPENMMKPVKIYYACRTNNDIKYHKEAVMSLLNIKSRSSGNVIRFYDQGSEIFFSNHNPIACRGKRDYDYLFIDDANSDIMERGDIFEMMLILNPEGKIIVTSGALASIGTLDCITKFNFQEVVLHGSQIRRN